MELLKQKVFAVLDQHLQNTDSTLVVAVSGGADSVALTLLAKEYTDLKGCNLEAVTIDHRLRNESTAEAGLVFKLLSSRGISHHTLVWHHQKELNRRHEKARKARYDLLLEFCHNFEHPILLTAHHQQDQVETILMRFLKGSGPAGFQGIKALRNEDGIPILRPLLAIAPESLREYLTQQGVEWLEDPSNDDHNYERTRVRQLVRHITELGWQAEGILASATKIYHLQQSLENLTRGYAQRFVMSEEPLTVDQPALFKCPDYIQQEWLKRTIWTIGGADYPKPLSTVNAVLEIIKQPKVNGYKIAGCTIEVARKQIFFKDSCDKEY